MELLSIFTFAHYKYWQFLIMQNNLYLINN